MVEKNYDNAQYVAPVGIGTPAQFLDVVLDTGSTNFWINSKLDQDLVDLGYPVYNHQASGTFSEVGLELEVEFGTGSVEGVINQDTVSVGNIKVRDQAFAEIVNEEGSVFNTDRFQGILGLGFPEMSAYGFVPLFDSIMEQHLLDNNMFSFYYSIKDSEKSMFTVGGYDEDLFTGEIFWVEVMEEYYWSVAVQDISWGNYSLGLCSAAEPCKAAIDTGTTLLTAPSSVLNTILNYVETDDGC